MELQEFSDQFDVLFNNITSNQAPGLNEYEKSVFLTKAETQLVRDYFNKRIDGYGGGFDGSEKRQYDFSSLIETATLYNVNSIIENISDDEKIDHRSLVFLFPENYFLSVNEILSDSRWQYSVLPIDYQEYQRLMLKPYNLPVKRGAWRLITSNKKVYVGGYNSVTANYNDYELRLVSSYYKPVTMKVYVRESEDSEAPIITENDAAVTITLYLNREESSVNYWNHYLLNNTDIEKYLKPFTGAVGESSFPTITAEVLSEIPVDTCIFDVENPGGNYTTGSIVEIIGKFKGDVTYKLRYVRALKPIILDDLTNYGDDLKIDGYQEAMECELPKEMHEEILERAVTLAKIAWQGGTATMAGAQSNNRD